MFSTPSRIFSKNVVAVVDLGSSGVVVSCVCEAFLNLKTDNQVEIHIASLYSLEGKFRDVFFDMPVEVEQSLVKLSSLVIDNLFLTFFLAPTV